MELFYIIIQLIMISRLLNRQIYILFFPFSIDYKSTNQKEKVSGPNPSNHDYIHYSDIQIR